MGRAIAFENYRVEVEPNLWPHTDPPHNEHVNKLEQVARAIRRHLADEIRCALVQYDRIPICEFCGRKWTEGKDDVHNGGCCDKDAANMPEETEAEQCQ